MNELRSWFEKFLQMLKQMILDEPPYWVFLFIGTVLLTLSLINQHHFRETWAFFIYAAVGTLWRHSNKDLYGGFRKVLDAQLKLNPKLSEDEKDLMRKKLCSQRRKVYFVVNMGFLVALFWYLDYFKILN